MAAPRPKKTAVKKKPPAKKKPSFLRKDTSRPARDAGKGGMRQAILDSLKQGPSQPQGPEAPRYPEKIGPKQPTAQSTTAKAPKTGILRGLGSKAIGAIGAIVDPTFLSGKGEGKLNNDPVTRSLEKSSTMSAMYKKQKREIRQGPKLAVTGVKEGTTRRSTPTDSYTEAQLGERRYRTPIGPKRPSKKPAPGSNYSGQEKKKIRMKFAFGRGLGVYGDIAPFRTVKYNPGDYAKYRSGQSKVNMPKSSMAGGGVNKPEGQSSTGSPFSKGKGNAALPKGKTGPSNTAATTAAAVSGGGSQAAAVAKAGGSVTNVSKTKVGKQTRYQRNETAMEQKRSSNRPKKSIFSLFRKG